MKHLVLILLISVQYVTRSDGYYYWKDFQERIPLDAVVAGQDINDENVYIGQALVYEHPYQGVYPTSILKDQDIYVEMIGARKANYFVQILCSNDPENFEWLLSNSTHLHLMNTDNELVRGGIEYVNGVVNIGRIRIHGETIIGKVMSEMIGDANMWFAYHEKGNKATTFEVLTYNEYKHKMMVDRK